MEKLLKLLNEFWDINWNKAMVEHQDTYIISKKFWFIKWLYDNEKIDIFCEKHYQIVNWSIPKGNIADIEDYERDIMQLSISDNPIQDLISLLK